MQTKRRTELRRELGEKGYAFNYLDKWQAKHTYYNHVEIKNVEGDVVKPAGTAFPGMPGHPEHAIRMAQKGFLIWEPGPTCQCAACRKRFGTVRDGTKFMSPAEAAMKAVERGPTKEPEINPTAPIQPVEALPFSGAFDCAEHAFEGKNEASLRAHKRHKH